MQFEIQPYQSVGTIHFNKKRNENREQFDILPEVHAMADGQLPIDAYEDWGVFVVYDKYDRCGEVEIKHPSQAILQGRDLLNMTWQESLSWFQSMDPEIQESDKEFISWKFGIGVYAPDKDEVPTVLPESITVFRKDYFSIKEGIPNPFDVKSFHIQVAFVEGIPAQRKEFSFIENAFKSIFMQNKEFGIILWNLTPVSFSYYNDLPKLLIPLTEMLATIQSNPSEEEVVSLECPAFKARWDLKWDEKFIEIKSYWERVSGDYEEVLNEESINTVFVLKPDFLAEFKLLLLQCHKAFKISKSKITNKEEHDFIELLKEVETDIPIFGKFYQSKIAKIPKKQKNNFNIAQKSKWLQLLFALPIMVFVIAPVWYLSKDKESPFWIWEYMPKFLMYLIPILLIILYFFYKFFQLKRND